MKASDILKVAAAELGTKENPAGSNIVKYNTDYYGFEYGAAWCVVFVWWVFRKANAYNLIYNHKTASCANLIAKFKEKGALVTKDYKPGDIVFYDWDGDGTAEHTGIVESVNEDERELVAIEGNTAIGNDSNGGEVMRRTRSMKYILCAGRPAYDEEEKDEPSAWAKNAADWAIENGIFTGDGNGNYRWHDKITREEVAQVLYNMANNI